MRRTSVSCTKGMSEFRPGEPQDLKEPQLCIRVAAMPSDANAYGDIFGGWLMSQIDIAGSVVAIQAANGRVATVAVKEMRFLKPVSIGDLVSLYGRLERMGNTSVTVKVEAYAEREVDRNKLQQVADAIITYVAVGDDRQPRALNAPLHQLAEDF